MPTPRLPFAKCQVAAASRLPSGTAEDVTIAIVQRLDRRFVVQRLLRQVLVLELLRS